MALTGKNRHYHWYNIQPKHFFGTAKQVNFNVKTAELIFSNMMAQIEDVTQKVKKKIPDDFPENIMKPIFEGMLKQRERYAAVSRYIPVKK